ncbi:TPA: ABC transporter permease, partial [Clostridioides difficile]
NAGLAFKQRYDAMAAGEGQFSYILLSTQPIPTEDLNKAAAAFGNMEYQAVLQGFPYTYEDENHLIYTDMVLSYTDYETYCKSIHKQVFAREPKPGNGLCLSKKYLISMADEVEDIVPFPRRSIHIQEKSEEYYFGIMQNNMNFIILNDEDYQ